MESALIDCGFAKEAECNSICVLIFTGECYACSERNLPADYSMAAEEVNALIKQVH